MCGHKYRERAKLPSYPIAGDNPWQSSPIAGEKPWQSSPIAGENPWQSSPIAGGKLQILSICRWQTAEDFDRYDPVAECPIVWASGPLSKVYHIQCMGDCAASMLLKQEEEKARVTFPHLLTALSSQYLLMFLTNLMMRWAGFSNPTSLYFILCQLMGPHSSYYHWKQDWNLFYKSARVWFFKIKICNCKLLSLYCNLVWRRIFNCCHFDTAMCIRFGERTKMFVIALALLV